MLEYQGRWRDTVIIVCLTRLVAIYDVSQFDYFRHLASAANTTAAAPPIWPRSERPAEALQAIVELDLDVLTDIVPPRGYGRD